MSELDLDAIQKLADGATPGPWEVGVTYHHQRNAEFIAAARTAVPALIAAVRARDAEIAQLRANWADLAERADRAVAKLYEEGPRKPTAERLRLDAKASGVALVRDYMRGYS